MTHDDNTHGDHGAPSPGDSAIALPPLDAELLDDEIVFDDEDLIEAVPASPSGLGDLLAAGLDLAIEVETTEAQREAEAQAIGAAMSEDLGDDDDALFEVMVDQIKAPIEDDPQQDHITETRIDLVAIDIDGTLLTSDKKLSKRTVAAIEEVKKQGVRVVLASARPPRTTRIIYKYLQLDTLQINYNGALILDPVSGETWFHKAIEAQVARRVIDLARQIDPKVVVNVENMDRWFTDRYDPAMTSVTGRTHKPDVIAPIDDWLHEPITKLMLAAPPKRLQYVLQAVREVFDDEVAILISDHHVIQMVDPLIDKSYALRRVAEHYNVDREHVMAIGDAPNDNGMLAWAGLGVAMGNAWKSARKAADVTVPTNDENGVVHALRQYVLEK